MSAIRQLIEATRDGPHSALASKAAFECFDMLNLKTALVAVIEEIEAAHRLKVGPNAILSPLHPICVQAANARAVLKAVEWHS